MAMLSSRMPIAALAGAILTLSLSSSLAHGTTVPADAKRITNETTRSHWVNPNDRGVIRNAPDSDSGAVARLKLNTEDGLPNVYLVLREWTDEDNGDVWFQVRIPQRPNGKTGWVREESVGPLQRVTTQLIVNRKTLRATLFRKGRKIFSTRVGVGKASTPTPAGRFWIREKLVLGGGHGVYGPLAFGTSAYSDKLTDWPKGGVVGIHGTNQPGLIPGRPSHGCIRMRNKAIKRLGRLMPTGTPLRII
jgi:hypothetical protein